MAGQCTECSFRLLSKDNTKCIFHAKPEVKGIELHEFRKYFWDRVSSGGGGNFRGYIFPNGFEFKSSDHNLDGFQHVADFTNAKFVGLVRIADFKFAKKVIFRSNVVDGTLLFEDTVFGHSLEFLDFIVYPKKRANTTIIFRGVNFPQNATFFRNINSVDYEESDERITVTIPGILVSDAPVFVFRQCCLKDVYFDSSDMGLFSFFKSSFFENAHIVACTWPSVRERLFLQSSFTTHTRRYVIPEEWLVRQLKSKKLTSEAQLTLYKKYDLWENFKYSDVGSIYRRIKTSLDNSKAYEEAAWLYYNEIEMRRVAWWEEFSSAKGLKKLPPFLWGLIYNFYKLCAGYGERPLNTVILFFVMLILFATAYIINGLQTATGLIDYDVSFTIDGFLIFFKLSFWIDWFNGLGFALLRLVPLGYIPIPVNSTYSLSVFLAVTNTIVLSFLLIFIGIGLKRHFKRF